MPKKSLNKEEVVVSEKKGALVHQSVLLDEVIKLLDLSGKKSVVDCTLGLGGHSIQMLKVLPKSGKLYAFELDTEHLNEAQLRLQEQTLNFEKRVTLIQENFAQLENELAALKVKEVDAILLDLGLASPHVDDAKKGFSFMKKGPLDMRFDKRTKLTAALLLEKATEKELFDIFRNLGEERHAGRIAKEIVKVRKQKPFKSTQDLADLILKLFPRAGKIHPATRVFQALRMAVNDEIGVLASVLQQARTLLAPGGRIAVISYHSLEDRVVKQLFRTESRGDNPEFRLITKKPVVPSEAEIKINPRSRSAKLRVAEKI